MSRWIDIDDDRNCYCGSDGEYEKWNIDHDVLAEARSEVEERKKSQWIKMSDADGIYYACNACGEDIPRVSHFDPRFDLFPRLKSIEKTNFCPNCGADMRGGDDEETQPG